jgi:hypothetical protein
MFDRIGRNLAEGWARVRGIARAWRCPDKILVIESDDWGSLRTSTAEAYAELASCGYQMQRSCYSVDALESDGDLNELFDVLDQFKDARGYPACITGNMVLANPDFAAIRENEFSCYVHEPVEATLQSSPGRGGVARLWREGMAKRLFRPQFHAREHVRWWEWLSALRRGSPEALRTFDLNMCGVPLAVSKERQSFFQPIHVDHPAPPGGSADSAEMIAQGLQLFHGQFGFRSLSTIAPNCAWTDDTESVWAQNGVRYIQGGYLQLVVTAAGTASRAHYLGQRSNYHGWYLVRNCTFEPSKAAGEDYWMNCLAQIAQAFRFKIPAIVCSHRVNYVGSIAQPNRNRGLGQLRRLLEQVRAKWPDVHFLSSAELGYMIENNIRRVRELDGKEKEIFPADTQDH